MRRPKAGRLVKNASALIISGGGSSLIGVVFWAVAAHVASAATIGRTSAELGAIILLATLAQLSFGSTFERFLPIAGDQTRLFIIRAYKLCTSIGLILAILYVSLGIGHTFLPSSFLWRALFVAAVVVWTVFALQDSVLIGLRATQWVPVENILYSLVKLALIPAFIVVSASQGILLAWLAPVIVMIVAVNWYLFRKRIPDHERNASSHERLPSLRELIVLTGAQYSTLLITVLSSSIVSLVVIDRLGAVASAHYYLPAQIAGGAAVALWSINQAFLVEASSEPVSLRHHARVALKAGIAVVVVTLVVGEALAPEILRIFGNTYAAKGTTLMRLMLLSLPGNGIIAFYSAFAWLDRKVWNLTIRECISTAVYFTLIVVFIGHFGILAIGISALITSCVQGILFLPLLVKRYLKAVRDGVTDVGPETGAISEY